MFSNPGAGPSARQIAAEEFESEVTEAKELQLPEEDVMFGTVVGPGLVGAHMCYIFPFISLKLNKAVKLSECCLTRAGTLICVLRGGHQVASAEEILHLVTDQFLNNFSH